ncbi:MAG TPA: hypothetical protein DDX54_02720 [Rhodospirillaceae bacterium]|jgi:TPR repeat protein|nr:sel1 repeat family protein [Alphaproteobacteria bacterium]HBH26298.1 hypothetical protein [Rhodospirillaceae bacterium]
MSTWVDLFIVGAPSASIVIVGIVCGTFLHILKCHPEWVKRILGFCQKHGVKLEGKFGSAALSLSMEKMSAMGQGDSPDAPKQTLEELKKAAEKGDAKAQYNLAEMYYRGQGVEQDYAQGAHWFRKAAEQGLAGAQGILGCIYALGRGVPQDFVQAYAWLNLAAAGKGGAAKDAAEWKDEFAEHRDGFAEMLDTEHLLEAQALSRTLAERIKKEKADSD